MAAGAVAGTLLGALIDLGVPETSARFYHDEVEAGGTVVLVHAGDRGAEARAILCQHGAREANLPVG